MAWLNLEADLELNAEAKPLSGGVAAWTVSNHFMEPLVSILIPAYNAEEFLEEAVKSALAQTWRKTEVIIVDDGSTDRTLAVARSFASEKVLVLPREHQGAAAARNHAFAKCQGNYIQWLDADDILAADKIEKQIKALERCASERTLLSSAWARFYYRLDKAKFSPTTLWCDLPPVDCILGQMNDGAFMQTTSWLVSRKLSEAAGRWDSRLLGDDDGEYFNRVVLQSDGVVFVPEARAYWRISGFNSLSYVGFSPEKLAAQLLSVQLRVNHLRTAEDSPRVRLACLNYLQWNLLQFYPDWKEALQKMEELAESCGGSLQTPRVSWKYAWVKALFGWRAAKVSELYLPNCKKALRIRWDKTLFLAGQRNQKRL